MSRVPQDGKVPRARQRRPGGVPLRRRGLVWIASPLALVLELVAVLAVGFVLVIALSEGRSVPLPRALAERIEQRAAEALGQGGLSLGGLDLVAEGAGRVRVRARDVQLTAADGTSGVAVPRMEAALAPGAFLGAPRAPRVLVMDGAAVTVTRARDGTLDFGLGAFRLGQRTPAEALALLQERLALPALQTLERVELSDLDLTYRDLRTGRSWQVGAASLVLERAGGTLVLSLDAVLPGRLTLRVSVPETGLPEVQVSALVDGVQAQDLAAQAPALAWLAPLEAAVSGTLVGTVVPGTGLGPLDGALEIGEGRFAPEGGAALPFERARAAFSFRPETGRLRFSALEVEAPGLRVAAEGHADLQGLEAGWPTGLNAQLRVNTAQVEAPDLWPERLAIGDGEVAAQIVFAPFSAELGQAVLNVAGGPEHAPARLEATGRATASPDGWHAALDLGFGPLQAGRLMALWPYRIVPRTRDWLARNLLGGRLDDLRIGMIFAPGNRPETSLSFAFEGAELRAMQQLPVISGAGGHASHWNDRFVLTLERGDVTPPEGGIVDLAGSSFVIPDARRKPPDAELRLAVAGPIPAVLSLLDQPPFGLMQRAGRPVALAEGTARLTGDVRFPMGRGVTVEQVFYDVAGTLSTVRSDVLVPGRVLTAERLTLAADPTGLTIAGRAALDGVGATASFRQRFGPERPAAEVTGRIDVTPQALAAFAPGLPAGTLSGAGVADITLRLPSGSAPELALTSDLVGVGLRIPALGWSKSTGQAGAMLLSGTLGAAGVPPAFDQVRLAAPGLEAAGRLSFRPGGGLEALTLDTARVGDWFDGAVTLSGRGAGAAPAITLRGGRLDLRRADLGGGGGGGAGGPLTGRLDRLILAEGVALTDLRADLTRAGGLSGTFSGRVNGAAAVNGRLDPGRNGRPALRVEAGDAGGVLAAAGVFDEARGGTLALSLTPATGAGQWDGALQVEGLRVTAAPGLAALLNTISVIGLLDQMNGQGLLFSTINAAFRLTPGAVRLTSASAVGPSLGISADGVYDMGAKRINLQGVLSPIYALNSIGQVFTREGEGLFGFNYSISGPVDQPEIFVNPLSILTPGAFRQIFRTAPPPAPEGRQ